MAGKPPETVTAHQNLEPAEVNSRAAEFTRPSAKTPNDVSEDFWLITRVCQDPPEPAALDELVRRHWKGLYGRCHLLTLDQEKAKDLAQDAWCRILRARHSLKPDGNFPAYLATVATNLLRECQC